MDEKENRLDFEPLLPGYFRTGKQPSRTSVPRRSLGHPFDPNFALLNSTLLLDSPLTWFLVDEKRISPSGQHPAPLCASLVPSSPEVGVVTPKENLAALKMLSEPVVRQFLEMDTCFMLADNYLLAMAFIYLKRASLPPQHFTSFNLFVALHLAHDMDEDDLSLKGELVRFAMGDESPSTVKLFMAKRDKLWHGLNYRTLVTKEACDEMMSVLVPQHPIWHRVRSPDHGGVSIPFHIREIIHNKWRTHAHLSHNSRATCLICEGLAYMKNLKRYMDIRPRVFLT